MQRLLLCGFLFVTALLAVVPGHAQVGQLPPDTSISKDSLQRYYFRQEQERSSRADTISYISSGFYQRAKDFSGRSRFWKEIYRILFREPANPMRIKQARVENLDQKWRRYNNRVIRRIIVKPLDVFGPKVYDTLAAPRNFLEKLGNGLHVVTRRRVIEAQLSFKRGDRFKSTLVSNNERVLRASDPIIDARILPIPTSARDSVDVLVITQDIFTLSGGFSPGGIGDYTIDLAEGNLLGLGHRLDLKYRYYDQASPVNNARVFYRVPYLFRRSFISAEVEALRYYDRSLTRGRIFRDFLFATTPWAGSFEVANSRFYQNYLNVDTITSVGLGRNTVDGWLGRAFPINTGTVVDDRVRVVVSGRIVNETYFNRPIVRTDTNQIFRNRTLTLLSFGYADRDYFRDVLINGYGRTEDIPYGLNFSVTGGMESNEVGRRAYAGIHYGQSRFLGRSGFLSFSADAGSFLNYTRPEQGALRLEASYFSRLYTTGRLHFRHFARLRYREGFNRFNAEFLTINNEQGVRNVGSPAFFGTRALVLNLETVSFINFDVLSFKVAPFVQMDFGWISQGAGLLERVPYLGFGGGLRLYNERLTLSTIQLRLGYYPNTPELSSPFRTNFAQGSPLPLQDFAIGQPQIVGIDY